MFTLQMSTCDFYHLLLVVIYFCKSFPIGFCPMGHLDIEQNLSFASMLTEKVGIFAALDIFNRAYK